MLKNLDFQIDMTYYCNLNCIYCIQKSHNKRNLKCFNLEKTILTLDKIILENPNLISLKIEFFGGEPLLEKENIYKIIEIYKDYKFVEFEITTNCVIDCSDLLLYIKNNNIKLKLSCSYDSIMNLNNRCSNNEKLDNRILNNIKKYIEISKEYKKIDISICTCIREKDSKKTFDILYYLNKELKNVPISLSCVFGEFWRNENFNNLHSGLKKFITYCINNKIENLPTIMTCSKKFFFYLNPYYKINTNIKDIETLEEINSETKRFTNKKKFNVFEVPIYSKKYSNEVKLLNLFKQKATSFKVFDEMTTYLLCNGTKKRFKKELFCLFNFNNTYLNYYLKLIKKINNQNIDLSEFFNLKKDTIILNELNKNYFILNNKKYKIYITDGNNSFYSRLNKNINISSKVDSSEYYYDLIHEICHFLIDTLKIKYEVEKEEEKCEEFINFFFEQKIKKGIEVLQW